MTKAAFTGGRTNSADPFLLDRLKFEHDITTVVVGDASGVDRDVARWALTNSLPFEVFRAQWGAWGAIAGPRRNQQMIDTKPDILFAFPGKKGTRDMIQRAEDAGIRVIHVK